MDHEQGDDPAWYEQQDDPPLLSSDFDELVYYLVDETLSHPKARNFADDGLVLARM
jgi:hypothetical protein